MTLNRINRAIEAAKSSANRIGQNRIEEVQIHTSGYAEPGYSAEVVATGNWNSITRYVDGHYTSIDDTPARLAAVLEKLNVSLEWNDEWSTCCDCGKLVRTSADSYCWTPSFYDYDGVRICVDCVREDPSGYLEYLEGNYEAANTMLKDLTEHGYVKLDEDYQNGLYGGQTDNPQKIAEALQRLGVEKFIFQIDTQGQFETRFSVYVHESEEDKIGEDFEPEKGPDPAVALKQNLEEMSGAMDGLPNDGIKYGYVKDGKGTARTVSAEEFANGIKDE